MSYRLSVDVVGAEELARAFREAPSLCTTHLSNGIERTARTVERLAKQYAPIEHGNLRGSINTKGPVVTGSNVEASVGTHLTYSRFQEEGTGIYGPRKTPIVPKNGKLLAWKVGGKWAFARSVKGVRPKRYFRRSRDEARPVMTENMREAMREIVGALAG